MITKEVREPKELQRYLVPDERIVVIQRRHWVYLWQPITLVVGWILVIGWLNSALDGAGQGGGALLTIVMWVWFALVLRLAWKVIDWWREVFIATDRRLLLTYGLITRKVAMMPLAKVTDMSYVRTVPGKVFGYGTFRMESAGQDQALETIHYVPRPDETYRLITTEIFRPPARRATDVRPPPGSGSALPVVEPDDVWWRR